jgi:hypothetical protein
VSDHIFSPDEYKDICARLQVSKQLLSDIIKRYSDFHDERLSRAEIALGALKRLEWDLTADRPDSKRPEAILDRSSH